MELVEFLRRMIDEDERVALDLMEDAHPEPVMTYLGLGPARVLREVEAKRAIIEWHREDVLPDGVRTGRCDSCENDVYPCRTLRLLALPYADQPGYRDEWKP